MKQFRLKNKYPGLPDDWDNGMIIGHGERGSASYYSPINGIYTDKHIPYIQCKNYPIHWEEIKNRNYEIISMSTNINSNIVFTENEIQVKSLYHDGFNIHSVKRLSDGEIFTLGDKISNKDILWANCHIEGFKIGCNISVIVRDTKEKAAYPLESLRTLKPLIITEDGVKVYSGDKYWCIDVNDKSKIYTFGVYGNGKIRTEEYIFFSTEKAAEEYILMNKPCLSIEEVMSIAYNPVENRTSSSRKLKEIVKSKLDG